MSTSGGGARSDGKELEDEVVKRVWQAAHAPLTRASTEFERLIHGCEVWAWADVPAWALVEIGWISCHEGEQRRIYDAYAGAFAIIHNNLDAAMQATNVTGSEGTLNRQAKSAARSAFESAKQRFFNHLITAMKTPSLIRAIDADLEAGHAAVIQIVSTGEALMERRLAEIPTEDWNDVQVDITPREYVLSGAPDNT